MLQIGRFIFKIQHYTLKIQLWESTIIKAVVILINKVDYYEFLLI